MTPCDRCKIRKGCDWLSEMCRLTPGQVVTMRPDLIKDERRDKLRQQKRDHNARVRAKRRAEVPELRAAFGRMLNEFGTYGKHEQVMRLVRAVEK